MYGGHIARYSRACAVALSAISGHDFQFLTNTQEQKSPSKVSLEYVSLEIRTIIDERMAKK